MTGNEAHIRNNRLSTLLVEGKLQWAFVNSNSVDSNVSNAPPKKKTYIGINVKNIIIFY